MDIIPEAIEDAKRNAKRMGFDNTHYEAGTAEEIIPRWYKEGYRADALIVDPPRTGLDDKLLDTILTYVPEKNGLYFLQCFDLGKGFGAFGRSLRCPLYTVC